MHSTTTTPCRICGNAPDNARYRAREMLHGTRETFEYFECGSCGCVQIEEIPADLAAFYPDDYFSFRSLSELDGNLVRRFIDPHRVRSGFGAPDAIGRVADAVSRPLDYIDWLKEAGLGPDAAVLDIGCGQGKTLLCMALGGLRPCHGVDPFIDATTRYRSGATVFKIGLSTFARESSDRYDLIMFQHSLEHFVDPREALGLAASLLTMNGRMLVVVPVAGSFAWETYRETWCNLDAPRHIHLLTRAAMEILAKDAGLKVCSAISVGGFSQFVGSERYKRDIPANDPRPDRALFTAAELESFARRTEILNQEGRGDQTRFILAPRDWAPGAGPP
jgi:SAM-dependent methyltransferase